MGYSGFYIYKHLDKKGKVLYVGLTTNMHHRQYNHCRVSSHRELIDKIIVADAKNKTTMKFYELYYINLHKTKYNKIYNRGDDLSWLKRLPKLKFHNYSKYDKGFDDIYAHKKYAYTYSEKIKKRYYEIKDYIVNPKRLNFIDYLCG